jgi:hypothetical protein
VVQASGLFVRDKLENSFLIDRGRNHGLAQIALALGRLLGQNVLLERLKSHHFTGSGDFEPFFGCTVSFLFRHMRFLLIHELKIVNFCGEPGT